MVCGMWYYRLCLYSMSMLLSVAAFLGAILIVKRNAWSLKFAASAYAVIVLSYEIYVLLEFLRGIHAPRSSSAEWYTLKNIPLVVYFWEVGKYAHHKITQAIRRPDDLV